MTSYQSVTVLCLIAPVPRTKCTFSLEWGLPVTPCQNIKTPEKILKCKRRCTSQNTTVLLTFSLFIEVSFPKYILLPWGWPTNEQANCRIRCRLSPGLQTRCSSTRVRSSLQICLILYIYVLSFYGLLIEVLQYATQTLLSRMATALPLFSCLFLKSTICRI